MISYRGVRVTVPSSWPVIDGAHVQFTCTSMFAGQSKRVFLGISHLGYPSCPLVTRFPPADGVWMQPGGKVPPDHTLKKLPGGQRVYLVREQRLAAAVVWYHHIQIDIGIGRDRSIERAILDSIRYAPGTPDSAVLGQCPAPSATPPEMPEPIRISEPLPVLAHQGTLFPEPAGVEPRVSAATVWQDFLHRAPGGTSNSTTWSISFGRYTARGPAKVNSDGTTTPIFQNAPAWLIEGQPVQTDHGPCSGTTIVPYDANTGRPVVIIST